MEITLQEIVFYVVAAAIASQPEKSCAQPPTCCSYCSAQEPFTAYWDILSWELYS